MAEEMTAMSHEGNGQLCWCGPSCPDVYPLPTLESDEQ